MDRRVFLTGSLGGGAALLGWLEADADEPLRVAVIGRTGKGDYGHDLDTCWLEVPGVDIAAVADEHEAGRAKAKERLRAPAAYADWRAMLAKEKPDLVSIAPRWPDCHREMLLACADAGVKGVLIEKPLARDLEEADAMLAAAERARTAVAIAHQTRYSPRIATVKRLIAEGRIGDVLEVRARGKEDARGGGEDLMVLGDHLLDLMRFLVGDPEWCFARVTAKGRPVARADVRPGGESMGPVAGDAMTVTYGFGNGICGYFGSSRAREAPGQRFGLHVFGTKGVISLGTGTLPPAWILEDPSWTLFAKKGVWKPVTSAGIGEPVPEKDGSLRHGNALAAQDLIRCVRSGARPASSIHDGRASLEMIMAVYESHRLNAPVNFPIAQRRHPLSVL